MVQAQIVKRTVAVLMVGAFAVGAVACSSDNDDSSTATTTPAQATCDAWANTVQAFDAFGQLDPINEGMNSVRDATDTFEQSVQQLADAVGNQYKPLVDDLKSSLDALANSVTSDTVSTSGVSDALSGVGDAWDALVAELQQECPDVTADTSSL